MTSRRTDDAPDWRESATPDELLPHLWQVIDTAKDRLRSELDDGLPTEAGSMAYLATASERTVMRLAALVPGAPADALVARLNTLTAVMRLDRRDIRRGKRVDACTALRAVEQMEEAALPVAEQAEAGDWEVAT